MPVTSTLRQEGYPFPLEGEGKGPPSVKTSSADHLADETRVPATDHRRRRRRRRPAELDFTITPLKRRLALAFLYKLGEWSMMLEDLDRWRDWDALGYVFRVY